MTDPYSVLGLSPGASDDDVKRAYRELARKYHPDNYQNNPLADLAEEKMKEINEAYNAINKMRAGGGGSGYAGGSAQAYQQSGYQYQQQQQSASPLYQRVRSYISSGNINAAEELLQSAPAHDAEWHFLMGHIAYRRGWLDEAYQNYQIACSAAPGNMEYRQALNMMQRNSRVYQTGSGSSGASLCSDPCTTYLCCSMITPWGGCCC